MNSISAIGGLCNAPATSLYLFPLAPNTHSTPAKNFCPLPNLFVDAMLSQLTGSATKVYAWLLRQADRTTGRKQHALEDIATGCGVGRATAWRALQLLVERGLIHTDATWTKLGRGTPGEREARWRNVYTITPPSSWKFQNEQAAAQKVSELAQNEQANTNALSNAHSQTQQTPRAEKVRATPAPDVAFEIALSQSTQANKCEQLPAVNTSPERVNESDNSATRSPLLQQVLAVGVKPAVARRLLAEHPPETVAAQLDALPHRDARNPAAVLVQSVRENWDMPEKYLQAQRAASEADARRSEAQQARESAERAKSRRQAKAATSEAENAELDARWAAMPAAERARMESEARHRLGVLGAPGRAPGAAQAMRRNLQREEENHASNKSRRVDVARGHALDSRGI